jgi:hypothetical protein
MGKGNRRLLLSVFGGASSNLLLTRCTVWPTRNVWAVTSMSLHHCHTVPFRRHIHEGLYGAFIIDPPTPRAPAKELIMVMNAFDTNFDTENEFYAVNTVAVGCRQCSA